MCSSFRNVMGSMTMETGVLSAIFLRFTARIEQCEIYRALHGILLVGISDSMSKT